MHNLVHQTSLGGVHHLEASIVNVFAVLYTKLAILCNEWHWHEWCVRIDGTSITPKEKH